MNTAGRSTLKLAYEGSVKRVFQSPLSDDALWFEFTDDYSVFDWGKMPDPIANKGRALGVIGAFFFRKLADPSLWQEIVQSRHFQAMDSKWLKSLFATPTYQSLTESGCASHFHGLVAEDQEAVAISKAAEDTRSIYMQVQKADVQRPLSVVLLGQNVFYYPPAHKKSDRLIPLEVVFRFGMPKGSSLKSRLDKDPDYARVLGLDKWPEEGEYFRRPVLEFYTKLEPKDRLLSVQEALLISGLGPVQFQELCDLALACALALFDIFAECKIELWDGKFEFISSKDKVLLADSIGPDELRLLYKGCHLSKEMIRQVYRGTAWEKALKESQKLSRDRCSLDWKEICLTELQAKPEPFSPEIRDVIDRLYGVIANRLTGRPLFAGHPDLDQFVSMASAAGLAGE